LAAQPIKPLTNCLGDCLGHVFAGQACQFLNELVSVLIFDV
jgi:hypothetical protein